jgi:hypothetical protein
VYAGLAKINSDWLIHAQPLRIWLPAKNDLPLIGPLFNEVWVAYAFSWAGCLYDLAIPFFLLRTRTRPYAYIAVVVFNLLTAVLFPIGMFPYIMIATALIFFSAGFHERILSYLPGLVKGDSTLPGVQGVYHTSTVSSRALPSLFALFLLVQMVMPLRYNLYPGELFWTEQGYRFSWRVMLIEKAGYAQFVVREENGRQVIVDNREFLTPLQEKMMATQPDMILQYAHILRDHFASQGFKSPEVYVDSYVALNGRLGKPLVSSSTDLAREKDSLAHKDWILSLGNEIQGI